MFHKKLIIIKTLFSFRFICIAVRYTVLFGVMSFRLKWLGDFVVQDTVGVYRFPSLFSLSISNRFSRLPSHCLQAAATNYFHLPEIWGGR